MSFVKENLKKKSVHFSEGIGAESVHITVVLKSSTSENEVCVCIDAATPPGRKRLGKKATWKEYLSKKFQDSLLSWISHQNVSLPCYSLSSYAPVA